MIRGQNLVEDAGPASELQHGHHMGPHAFKSCKQVAMLDACVCWLVLSQHDYCVVTILKYMAGTESPVVTRLGDDMYTRAECKRACHI